MGVAVGRCGAGAAFWGALWVAMGQGPHFGGGCWSLWGCYGALLGRGRVLGVAVGLWGRYGVGAAFWGLLWGQVSGAVGSLWVLGGQCGAVGSLWGEGHYGGRYGALWGGRRVLGIAVGL